MVVGLFLALLVGIVLGIAAGFALAFVPDKRITFMLTSSFKPSSTYAVEPANVLLDGLPVSPPPSAFTYQLTSEDGAFGSLTVHEDGTATIETSANVGSKATLLAECNFQGATGQAEAALVIEGESAPGVLTFDLNFNLVPMAEPAPDAPATGDAGTIADPAEEF